MRIVYTKRTGHYINSNSAVVLVVYRVGYRTLRSDVVVPL